MALSSRHTFALQQIPSVPHPGPGALSCENAKMTCRWENYDHKVMRLNRQISLYLLKCAYLSNGTGLWVILSSYLVSLPDSLLLTSSASAHFSSTTCFLFLSSLLRYHYPLHCLGISVVEMIFHSVFHYSKVVSPICLLPSCHHFLSADRNLFLVWLFFCHSSKKLVPPPENSNCFQIQHGLQLWTC